MLKFMVYKLFFVLVLKYIFIEGNFSTVTLKKNHTENEYAKPTAMCTDLPICALPQESLHYDPAEFFNFDLH